MDLEVENSRMPRRWTPVVLLSLASLINYMDRGSLSVALPFVAKEMHLDPLQEGWALSAFSVTYVLSQMPVGWLVDRVSLKWLYAACFALWCGASAATGLATGLMTLILCRLLLGMGEAIYLPGGMKFIAEQFLPEERSIPAAVFDVGCKLGLALGLVVEVWILRRFGWRWLFLSTGFGGLVWLLPWLLLYPKPQVKDAPPTRLGSWEALRKTLSSRNAWGMAAGYACWNYFWYLVLNWGPTYLYKARGVPLEALGWVASAFYLIVAMTEVGGGWLVKRLVHGGWTLTRAIRFVIAAGFAIGMIALPASMVTGRTAAVGLFYVSALSGIVMAGLLMVPLQVSPRNQVGSWVGFQNFIGNIPGIAGPVITGWIVKRTGSFVPAFALAAVICLAGIWCYLGWVRLDRNAEA
ncbi:Sugar phosphate permease [Granulicella pectinivorans]|uniref:Sugar phosphate permease n=2 Tax=Granulicella pectinivorans TaxID=474950 RepID=A0A1I6MYR4_9BACT|nr:Sugar phosphate permease [Granulicella pectinivorans]